MKVWRREFEASYVRDDGVLVLNDGDVPFPDGFVSDRELRSNVVFPPGTRAGDHYHSEREEVFVGFGVGMEIVVEDKESGEVRVFKMDPSHNGGKCEAFWMEPGMPHAVRNVGDESGYLVEFASLPQEKVDYEVNG